MSTTLNAPVVAFIEDRENQIIKVDPSGRTRVSQLTTLFDGKILDRDDPIIWSNVGTGSFTFNENQMQMTVGAGEYVIRESTYRTPYFSGKPQFIEMTLDNFDVDIGVVKRFGYYSSSEVSPFDQQYDGVLLENNDGDIRLKAFNKGVPTMDIPIDKWSNYKDVVGYNWSNFSVIAFDFLWLGGTSLRLFAKTNKGFILLHEEPWATTSQGTFIRSPNQHLRYEMRSTTGTGEMNAICSQVATEGSINTVGKSLPVFNKTGISVPTVETIYAVKSVRLNQATRSNVVQLSDASVANTSGNDAGLLLVIINPTTSAPAVYTDKGSVEEGEYPSGTTITVDTGRLIAASPAGRSGIAEGLTDNFLSFLGDSVDGVSEEYVLAYMPITTNQTIYGTMTIKEY